MNRTFNIKKS